MLWSVGILLLGFICAAQRNLYDVLELKRTASDEDVKHQFRKLARLHHPDKSTEVNAQAKFIEISAAYETLGDPVKRRQYDRDLVVAQQSFKSMHQKNSYNFHPQARNRKSFSFSFSFNEPEMYFDSSDTNIASSFSASIKHAFIALLFILAVIWYGGLYSPMRATSAHVLPREHEIKRHQLDLKNFISQRKCVAIVACNDCSLAAIKSVKIKFKADPMVFYCSVWAEVKLDGCALVAITGGGSRWCMLRSVMNPLSKEGIQAVENWLIRLLNGEEAWTAASRINLPFELPAAA